MAKIVIFQDAEIKTAVSKKIAKGEKTDSQNAQAITERVSGIESCFTLFKDSVSSSQNKKLAVLAPDDLSLKTNAKKLIPI